MASDSVHLKPGALPARLGQVALVEDLLMVHYLLATLNSIPHDLHAASEELGAVMSQLRASIVNETYLFSTSSHFVLLLQSLSARVNSLHARMNNTMHDYSLHPVHARTKRGLVDGLGKVSQYLIGTAMDVDVQDLRRHNDDLIKIATIVNKKIVMLNYKKVAKLETNVQELLEQVNDPTTNLNEALRRLGMLTPYLVINQFLLIIKASLNYVISIIEKSLPTWWMLLIAG